MHHDADTDELCLPTDTIRTRTLSDFAELDLPIEDDPTQGVRLPDFE